MVVFFFCVFFLYYIVLGFGIVLVLIQYFSSLILYYTNTMLYYNYIVE